MEEEKTETVQQRIAAHLSDALMRSNHAKGVIIIMAIDDDTIWSYGAGDIVIRLGLLSAAQLKAKEMWDDGRVPEGEEDGD